MKRNRKGKFVRGVQLFPVGSVTPPSTKGEYFGVGSAVRKAEYNDKHPLIGRKVDTHKGGLDNRAEWVRYQSGGLTPSELLRAAGN